MGPKNYILDTNVLLHDPHAIFKFEDNDVILRDEPLPSDLQEGDFVYIRNAGAYTTAYASQFNGFPLPEVRVFESKKAESEARVQVGS